MIVTYALEPLLNSPLIDAVWIVAEHEWREVIVSDAGKLGLNTVKIKGFAVPGVTRQVSIWNGLHNILCWKDEDVDIHSVGDEDTVLIHDAARPLFTEKLIEECYASLEGWDGVMPVLPMKDTVYLSRNGIRVDELLERGQIYAGQAPELFNLKKYYLANKGLMPDNIMEINGSSEPAVRAGMNVVMIPGDEGNYKITTEADILRFRKMMGETT